VQVLEVVKELWEGLSKQVGVKIPNKSEEKSKHRWNEQKKERKKERKGEEVLQILQRKNLF